MTLPAVVNPFDLFTDARGALLNAGKIYIGVAGQDPETNPQAVFWDAAGTIPAAQPLDTMGGYIMRAGSPAIPYTLNPYSIRVRDRLGNQVYYVQSAGATRLTALDMDYTPFVGAVTRTVSQALSDIETLSLDEFVPMNLRSAVYSGALSASGYIQAMVDRAEVLVSSGVRGVRMLLPPRPLYVTSTILISTQRVSLECSAGGALRTVFQRNTNYGPTVRVAKVIGGVLQPIEDFKISGVYFLHGTFGTPMTSTHLELGGVTSGSLENLFIAGGKIGIAHYGSTFIRHEKVSCSGEYDLATDLAKNNETGVLLTLASKCPVSAAVGAAPVSSIAAGMEDLCKEVTFDRLTVLGPRIKGYRDGVVVEAVEDCSITQSYLGNAQRFNLRVEQTAASGILEFRLENTYVDAAGTHAIYLGGVSGTTEGYIGGFKIIGCDIKGQLGDDTDGIFVDGTVRVGGSGTYPQAVVNMQISDTEISDHGRHGLNIQGGRDIVLADLRVHGNNYDNTVSGASGLLIGPNVRMIDVIGGRYGGGATGELMGFQDFGITVQAGATYVGIRGVTVRGNRVQGILDQAASAATSFKAIENNPGYNGGRAAVVLAPAASGVALTNPYGVAAQLAVNGGTGVTDIQINGQSIFTNTGHVFMWGRDDTLTITYATAPGIVAWPQ